MKYALLTALLLTSCTAEIAIGTSSAEYVKQEQFNAVVQVLAQRLNALEKWAVAQKKVPNEHSDVPQ